MNININKVKISVTVPSENVNKLREEMCKMGAGVIGNYSHCSISTNCIGTFKPNKDADPYIGLSDKMEFVEEIKLELICEVEKVKKVISKLREVHPYEEPGIDIIPLIDEDFFN